MKVLVAQSGLNLYDPMDSSPPGKNIGVDCCAFLQGIFLTEGLNTGLLHCRWVLYCLSYQGIEGRRGRLIRNRAMMYSKTPPAMQETPVRFLGWEDPLEKG